VDNLYGLANYTNNLGLKVTSGYLSLVQSNSYTGPTLISGGTLSLDLGTGAAAGFSGQLLGSSPVTVNNTGTLGGFGIIMGPVTIGSGGTLSPGNSDIGTLAISNNVTLNSGSIVRFNVNNGVDNDSIVGISNLLYNGTTLIVSNTGSPFAAGNSIKLFDAATNIINGSIAIQPASPGSGLMWVTTNLAVNGTLLVAAAPAAPPAMSKPTKLAGGSMQLTLSGTVGQSYTIYASTNAALPIGSWTVLQSGTLPSSPYQYTDQTATNYSKRFYKISTP
jgi:autotransporter-associated beta strand protein